MGQNHIEVLFPIEITPRTSGNHPWLSLLLLRMMLEIIRLELQGLDP
jgi:hypothetical protein